MRIIIISFANNNIFNYNANHSILDLKNTTKTKFNKNA